MQNDGSFVIIPAATYVPHNLSVVIETVAPPATINEIYGCSVLQLHSGSYSFCPGGLNEANSRGSCQLMISGIIQTYNAEFKCIFVQQDYGFCVLSNKCVIAQSIPRFLCKNEEHDPPLAKDEKRMI